MSRKINKPILLLVDGHSLAFRSFYAFSKGGENGLETKNGIPTSVTYGFLKALLENCKNINPKGITIAFDTAEPTFRVKKDENYKANRDVAPEIFFQDLEKLEEILIQKLNISICKAPGYEADDVLGTLANKAARDGWRVRILTGDRDLFQLVNDNLDISVMYMGGGSYNKSSGPTLITEAGVIAKLGVSPRKVVDLKALTGDSSDNIPGVKGVGPKTAINLLKENEDLDGVYKTLSEVEKEGEKAFRGSIKGALKAKLRNDKENAYLSRYLAEIVVEVPAAKEARLTLGEVDYYGLKEELEKLELYSLAKQIPSFIETFNKEGLKEVHLKELRDNDKSIKVYSKTIKTTSSNINNLNTEHDEIPKLSPKIIYSNNEFDELIEKLFSFKDKSNPIAIDTETTSLNPFKAELVGIGFCWGEQIDQLAYIPIGHVDSEGKINTQLSIENVISKLSPWLESSDHPKALQNAKYDRLILMRHGISLAGLTIDTLLADYLIDSNAKHSLEEISIRELGYKPTSFKDLVKKGETFANVSIEEASKYCGMDVFLTKKISLILSNKLKDSHPETKILLEEVEQPLESVLAEMEATGIRIDIQYLEALSKEITFRLKELEVRIIKESNEEFNISSPKQLADILFNKIGLDKKKSRKTSTGWSTDASVLDKLKDDHIIVSLIIEHRILNKLLSTYVDALPQLVEEETGRVHTDFNQAVTTTGRLSSSNPNLQNIPIRTEFSRRIRKAFLPKAQWKLLRADYSQIELRILAHLSGEEVLQKAFNKGDDVHELTAKILLDKEIVNENERRLGKTINFGVIYGMGAQRFARSTGVSQSEAKEFLVKYKQRYPKVFHYLELQERLALSQGYVTTILGRRRIFNFSPNGLGRLRGKDTQEIDLNFARRAGMEAQQLRAAANAPIQGSSADIIKIAMVQLHKKIKEAQLSANLLLQVHDELVLEFDPQIMKEVEILVRETMEGAILLSVPLLVETGVGKNWMEAK